MTLTATGDGWRLEGAAAFGEAGEPCHLRYRVEVDARWRTRRAEVHGWHGPRRVDVAIERSSDGVWLLGGEERPAVAGCIDVDLALTPATNLLPIRRLGLAVGEGAPVDAAWLPFPEIDLRRLDQTYRRAAENAYEYTSSGGSFRAALTVSPVGLVTHYEGLWREEERR